MQQPSSTSRIPAADACVVRNLLDRHAANIPERVAILFEDDTSWTYAQLRTRVIHYAAALQQLGVAQGDFVACWLPNGAHQLTLWYALNYLGAVFTPINIHYRGALLENVIQAASPKLMITDALLVDRLAGLNLGRLGTVVVLGAHDVQLPGVRMLDEAALQVDDPLLQPLQRPIEPWDPLAVIFTSGTTGPSKGAVCSYVQFHQLAVSQQWVTHEDRSLIALPLFHGGGCHPSYRMLYLGGSIAMVSHFTTQTFWDTVRRTRATTLQVLGTMAAFLVSQPVSARDTDHTLRTACVVPLDGPAIEFGRRFNVEIHSIFGMTEISTPLLTEANPQAVGSSGRPRAGVELRLVDANDCEVATGEVGELIVRTDMPWAMAHEYLNNPEGTARAWRNGWFHTGDGFRRDAENHFFYVDRIKDSIRRRGENVSSMELEKEILAFAGIAEAAVVAVASEHGEDEILAVVVIKPDHSLEPRALIEFLLPRVAHFSVPRYVRVAEQLPKTPTHKVLKRDLREAGVTADTWDRESAGVQVKRVAIRGRQMAAARQR
ncbi:MAG: AMP-binding protein [Janthinobacterium lividum]